jgi:flagellar motility protein MotE (MotC chaperone)
MKTKSGSGLLSVALGVILVILVAKLAITIGGSLTTRDIVPGTPEVLAGEEKPAAPAEKAKPAPPEPAAQNPVEKPAKSVKQAIASNEAISFLQQKEADLKRREDLLKEKEDHLDKVQQEIEQKTKDLLAIQKQLQAAASEKQESQNTKVRGLAKIYGTMKPKDAAKLFENLDDKLVMGIIATMTPDEAASILALMDVKKAAKISEALSGR